MLHDARALKGLVEDRSDGYESFRAISHDRPSKARSLGDRDLFEELEGINK